MVVVTAVVIGALKDLQGTRFCTPLPRQAQVYGMDLEILYKQVHLHRALNVFGRPSGRAPAPFFFVHKNVVLLRFELANMSFSCPAACIGRPVSVLPCTISESYKTSVGILSTLASSSSVTVALCLHVGFAEEEQEQEQEHEQEQEQEQQQQQEEEGQEQTSFYGRGDLGSVPVQLWCWKVKSCTCFFVEIVHCPCASIVLPYATTWQCPLSQIFAQRGGT